MFYNIILFQHFSKILQKNSCLYLEHIEISSTFAPAFQEMVSLEIDILTATVYELHQISLPCPSFLLKVGHWKRKKKKTFENIWKLCNKVLTFAPAFRKEAIEWLTTWTEAWCLELYLFRFSFISLSPRETTRKRKWKKTSKIFGRYTWKFLPLQPLSEKKVSFINEAIFERFT